jgi:hypothetical protein
MKQLSFVSSLKAMMIALCEPDPATLLSCLRFLFSGTSALKAGKDIELSGG